MSAGHHVANSPGSGVRPGVKTFLEAEFTAGEGAPTSFPSEAPLLGEVVAGLCALGRLRCCLVTARGQKR